MIDFNWIDVSSSKEQHQWCYLIDALILLSKEKYMNNLIASSVGLRLYISLLNFLCFSG
jgi:hypothetical protein